jgi:hypothetical protein
VLVLIASEVLISLARREFRNEKDQMGEIATLAAAAALLVIVIEVILRA